MNDEQAAAQVADVARRCSEDTAYWRERAEQAEADLVIARAAARQQESLVWLLKGENLALRRRIPDSPLEALLHGRPKLAECPICGGLPPGEASGTIDICTCDWGVDAELPGRSPLETLREASE